MRHLRYLLAGLIVVALVSWAGAQPPEVAPGQELPPAPATLALSTTPAPQPMPTAQPLPAPTAGVPDGGEAGGGAQQNKDLVSLQDSLNVLRAQRAAAQGAVQQDEKLKKLLDVQQRQIETLEKMVRLLAAQIGKQPAGGATVEKLQLDVATLEGRSKQAAQRDQEVQQAVDNLTEHIDAEERNGPRLPATLKELFLPTRTNETPLSIYGSFVENYTQLNGKPGVFSTPDFAPFFLIQLNNEFLLAASIDISNAGVSVGEAQINWFATDWMTVVLGRYLTPIGFFNERLNHEWINRLPDVPLMFRQVSPLTSNNGLMLRGATYLFGSPVKLEYEVYGGNGLQAAATPTSVSEVANLQNITGGPDETNVKALGGRLGLWIPEWGLTGGVSTYFNGRYSPGAPDQFNLWQLDLGYRKGDWDVRFEYADTYQQAASYIGNNIRRRGFYGQVAYRPYNVDNCLLSRMEVAFRYSRVWFRGIDPTALDPTTFDTPIDIPVNREQWTFGLNYYFYASMALRLAYEINHELNGIDFHDNEFLGQFVWAF